MKILKLVFSLLLTVCILCSCSFNKAEVSIDYYDELEGYNENIFYKNDITQFGADPGVIYIDDKSDKENYGYFYLYPTSDAALGTIGIAAYRSKDLVNWESVSVALYPDNESYASLSFWAPECVYDKDAERSQYGLGDGKGVYYLFYSSNDKDNTEELVFANHEEEEKYKIAKAKINKMTFEQKSTEINKYRSSTDERIKAIIISYDSTVSSGTVDADEEAQKALLQIQQLKIECEAVINDYSLGIAVSKSPAGPFIQYTRENPKDGERKLTLKTPFISSEDMTEYAKADEKILNPNEIGFTMIDPSPFVDPQTGKKYLVFVRRTGRSGVDNHFICGIEMGENWTDDPKWETLTRLTDCGYKEVGSRTKADVDINSINEGPFLYYNEGTYYLTYSVGSYNNATYSVAQALSDSVFGKYTKIDKKDGGYVLVADGREDVSGAGHHCFVNVDEKLYIIYHAHWDRVNKTGQRGFQADEVFFTENNSGKKVMQCNGPTVVPMPILGPHSEWKNISGEAEIFATNSDKSNTKLLNDGKIATISYIDFVKEFTSKGKTKITLNFNKSRTVKAIMIFNSKDSDYLFEKINQIAIYYTDTNGEEKKGIINNLKFNRKEYVSDSEVVTRCASSIAEFDELNVNKIEITVNQKKQFNISEIYVLGK